MTSLTPAIASLAPSRVASLSDLDRVIPELTPDETEPLLEATQGPAGYGTHQGADVESGTGTPKWQTRWELLRTRSEYYIPGTLWIPNYSTSTLFGDIIAGITIASIIIPQSISYASSLAKLEPTTGLFAAAIPGFIYALLGSCPQLSVGPEAALALIVGQAISSIMHSDPHGPPENPIAVAIAASTIITFQAGCFTFFLGVIRLGFLDVVLSRALLRGFVTAVACVIAVEQFIPMFGLVGLEDKYNPHTTVDKIEFLVRNLTNVHYPTTVVAFSTLCLIILVRQFKQHAAKRFKWTSHFPEVLITVGLSTLFCSVWRWDLDGVPILGDVKLPKSATHFAFPASRTNLVFFKRTTSTAILISIVGFLDSIVAAKQNSNRFGYPISLNRELVALGVANIAGSFVPGTLPAFGAITRSRLNADSGSRTPLSSVISSSLVLLSIFFLLPLLHFLPKGVLAAIICLVVIALVREAPEDIYFYWKLGAWTDLAMMTLTFLLTLLWNVEVGITVSVAVSLLLVIHRSSRARLSILGRIPGTDAWKPINEDPTAQEDDLPGVLIIRIRENLDFANTTHLKDRLRRLELYGIRKHHPSDAPSRGRANVLVFHMADMESVDASATQIFLELLESSKARGVGIYFAHLREDPKRLWRKAGIMELLGEAAFQKDVAGVVAQLEQVEGITMRRRTRDVPER